MIDPLTLREAEILIAMIDPWKELGDIARELNISRGTIAQHTVNIYSKLGVTDRNQAVIRYARINPDYRREVENFLQNVA
jgi:DNA-binding NarL/FixJ family response regulator